MATATALNNVPKFTIKNGNTNDHPVGPNGYNKWRKMCKTIDQIDTIDISNTQLPWMSLYKTHKDLLKIDLVTTVGYDISNNNIGPAQFMRGFPLMLQGPPSQFNDSDNISSNHWEYNWPFYKNHVEDFSGNLTDGGVDWLNTANANGNGNSQVITDFNDQNRRNLLILDLSKFYLHNNNGQHEFNDDGYIEINSKGRPDYLVIRLDTAIEESSFSKDNIHGKARDDLMVFNYVYSGYVISPYDFMANFTTDYLRSEKVINNNSSNYYINRDNPYKISPAPKEDIKDTIQLRNNKGIWEDAYVLGPSETKRIAKSHNKIISPFRYNFHLFPSQLEVFDFLNENDNIILNEDVSDNPIGPATDVYDISANSIPPTFNQSRFNTIESTLSLLGPHPPNNVSNWTYHIENLIWCSLSSSRHTLYAKSKIKKQLYIGNYLNINEVEYDASGNYSQQNEITTDTSGKITSAHENSNYMPTFKKASGSIIRDLSGGTMVGLNEVNMPRKTLTPYYKVDQNTGSDYNFENYAFNWNDTSKSWSTLNSTGIDQSTNKIDVSNCTVVEYRNLVEFKDNMSIQYTFNENKKTTFVTSVDPINDQWKGGIVLDNNSIKACDVSGNALNPDKLRLLSNGKTDEHFKVEWSGTDLSANTSKYGYLIDVASGSHEVTDISCINVNVSDTFLRGTLDKDKFKIISRVFQIRLDKLNDDNTIDISKPKTINYNIDSNGADVVIYSYPNNDDDSCPLFGYLNFIGIRSTELLGNAQNYLTIKNVFKNETRPYFKINDISGFKSAYATSSKIIYNSNIFYARTNFTSSNVILTKDNTAPEPDGQILFRDKATNIDWRDGYTNGLEITKISTNDFNTVNDKGIKLTLFSTDVKLFITTLIGKSNRDKRTLESTLNTIRKSIEVNNNLKMEYIDKYDHLQKNIKFNFLQFDNINFCSSQGNLFLSDFWKWSEPLVSASKPEISYEGPPNTIVNRNLENRYNVYNWDDTDDISVDDDIYNTGLVHNPQFAFENQSLINFIVELSSISINYSHVLVNTWRGAKIGNKFQSIGLRSFTDSEGTFVKDSNPVFKIKILGGDQITPTIATTPAIFDISANAKFNFATDLDKNDEEGNSKAPSNINEADGTYIDFTNAPFTTEGGGGWFAKTGYDVSRNGIFIKEGGDINPYNTIDFSSNIISESPTNLTLTESDGATPISGRFSKEEQEFPFELLFCYPYDIPELLPEIPKPEGYTTIYPNSDGVTTTKTFPDDFKGHKRFSNIYAISLTGSSSYGNENFENRLVFPENIIINCVELPPPLQVNNFNDMLAFDNNSVKIVWKGYNFTEPTNDFRSKYGDTGDIIWKIERFQTQLGIRKTLYNDKITPDDGYSLSTYTFIDNSIRIYDKYIYTVTGTYEYKFKRVFVNINSNTLSLNFGSFNTDEIIICKNNKFEYGRYNTTSTNLKLFRPLLIKREGGQVDEQGNQTAGGRCIGNIFSGSTRISSSQNIYANTSNTLTKKQTYVLLSKNQNRPFR